MKEEEVLQKIIKIITPYVKNEIALKEVQKTTKFIEDLKINSARLVDIVLEIEDTFNFAITDAEAIQISTVGDAVTLAMQKINLINV